MSLDPEQKREFVGLIVSHQTRLRAYIISLMPGIPGVSDVLQETNILLWEKMDSFEPGSNFTAWSFTIARYEVLAHCRKLKRRKSVLADPDFAARMADQISANFEEDDEMMERRIRALQKCMEKLSTEGRELVTLRYSEGTSLAEYARKTGRSDSSLRTTLLRARTALRKCISTQLARQAP